MAEKTKTVRDVAIEFIGWIPNHEDRIRLATRLEESIEALLSERDAEIADLRHRLALAGQTVAAFGRGSHEA